MTTPAPVAKVYAPHRSLTMTGTLGSSNEEAFSMGLSLDEGFFGGAVDQVVFDDIVADCKALFTRPATAISNKAVLREVKVAKIGADGKYLAAPLISLPFATPGGSLSGLWYPPQIALAVSLTTGRRGPSGKGRFYLPMPTAQIQDNLGITPTIVTEILGSVHTFLQAINNRPGVDPAAPGLVVASSKGFNTRVTGVRLGRIFDTIRSRRRSLFEAYTPVTVVT